MHLIEKHFDDCDSLTLLFHGTESSKNDWLEKNGYTKGGNFIELLNEKKMSWIALDLYGHGDWTADEAEFDRTDISDELWPKFITASAAEAKKVLSAYIHKYKIEFVNLVSYSAGCHIIVNMLRTKIEISVGNIIMAASGPEKDYDDEFAFHNNLEIFNNNNCTFFWGKNDDDEDIKDNEWFYNMISGNPKKKFVYNSSHSLPINWVYECRKIL